MNQSNLGQGEEVDTKPIERTESGNSTCIVLNPHHSTLSLPPTADVGVGIEEADGHPPPTPSHHRNNVVAIAVSVSIRRPTPTVAWMAAESKSRSFSTPIGRFDCGRRRR